MSWRHLLGVGGITLLILYLGTRWDWVVTLTLCQLYVWGKSPWDTFSTRLVVPQSQVWCQLYKDLHLKIMLHYVLLLQDILLSCQVQSIGYHGKGVGGQLLNSVTYSSPSTVGGELRILKHWFLSQKCNPTYMSSSGATQNPNSRVFGLYRKNKVTSYVKHN